jgi:hypothetical protein
MILGTTTLPPGVSIKLFADDCKIYIVFVREDQTSRLSIALENIFVWINKWQLKLSIEKCAVLHLGCNNPKNSYYIGNNVINACETYRDLGIIVDDKLNFHYHCNSIIDKAYQRMNLIFRTFKTKHPDILKWAYCVYVRPLLEYGSSVWSPYLKGDIDNIEKVQAYFTRRALGYNIFDVNRPSYLNRLQMMSLPSLELRRLQNDLCFFYKIVNGTVRTNIAKFIEFPPNNNYIRGRHRFYFRIKNCDGSYRNATTSICNNYFLNRIVNIWNNLPNNIFDSPNSSQIETRNKIFKRNIFSVNLNKYLTSNLLKG